jgi:hypothetical protein
MTRLDIPAQRVLRLERSLSDVQVVLPGFPGQEATAYLCAFSTAQGIRVAVVLHLHHSDRLAFYLNDEGDLQKPAATRVYNQALAFAESMGFMMGDLDIHVMPGEDRQKLWRSLPLAGGIEPAAGGESAGRETRRPAVAAVPPQTAPAHAPPRREGGKGPTPGDTVPSASIRRPPSPADLAARRQQVLKNLGRFLATL